MVPEPAAYPWASDRWQTWGDPEPLVTDHARSLALGRTPEERPQAYQALVPGQLHAGLVQEIRTTLQQGRV